jgi:hypothetical protein
VQASEFLCNQLLLCKAPPTGHTVLWAAIASGVLSAPDELRHGDLAAFEPSSESVEFEALCRVTQTVIIPALA